MKLYTAHNACALACHIALAESGLPFTVEHVNLGTKKTAGGVDFRTINSRGYVPALEIDGVHGHAAEILTEGVAIMTFIAERAPQANLIPTTSMMSRYRFVETMNYLSTEIHKGFSILWSKSAPEEQKAAQRDVLGNKFSWIASQLEGKSFLFGNDFSVADGYLFTLLGWTKVTGIELNKWPTLVSFCDRVAARPAIKAVIEAEAIKV